MISFFFVLWTAIACAAPSSAAASYRVLALKNSDLPVTAFNITFRVGSADDPTTGEGLALITARMLREGGVAAWNGLPARTRAELEDYLFPFAADVDVSVGKEQIAFRVTASASDAEAVFKVLTQLLLAPAFDAAEFDRIRAETLDALTKQIPREDEEELGKAALEQRVFGAAHPYSHHVLGTVRSVQALTPDKVREFYRAKFTRSRLTVGLAGVVSARLARLADRSFGSLPASNAGDRADVPKPPQPKGPRLLLVKGPFDAVGVHLGAPLPFNRSASDFDRMYLAAMAFGKHRSFVGRLMRVVREVRGLNYGTYAYVEDFPHGGSRLMEPTQAARARQAFTLWARPTPLENGCFLLRQVHREVKKLVEDGLTEEEFGLGRSHLIGNAPLLATGLERRLGYAIDSGFYGIAGDYLARLQRDAKAARRGEVNALLGKYLDPSNMEIVVVTPDPEKFKERILSPRCDIKYAEGVEKPREVLEEDKVIATYSFGLTPERISVVDADALFK